MSLEHALNRALSIRLNLQITLSGLPIVEEWMDIHLDRWLEHIPSPPEMPMGHAVAVTPLQIVMGMSVIENQGTLMSPQIVK